MGLGFLRSSSYWRLDDSQPTKGDPVPTSFTIVKMLEIAPFIVAEIQYPEASNYEGRKIALYHSSRAELESATYLDPHFQEQRGALVPIARFEPTIDGWNMAVILAELLAR